MSVKTLLWAMGNSSPINVVCETPTHYLCTDGFRLHAMAKTEKLPETVTVIPLDELEKKVPLRRLLEKEELLGTINYNDLFNIINFLAKYDENFINFSSSKLHKFIASTSLTPQSFAIVAIPLQLEISRDFKVSYSSKLVLQAVQHIKTNSLVNISFVVTDKLIIKFASEENFSLVAPVKKNNY